MSDGAPGVGAEGTERRRFERYLIQGVFSDLGPLLDLSLGGAMVLSERAVEEGDRLTLSLRGAVSVALEAVCVWSAPAADGRLTGVQFTEPSEETEDLLRQLIRRHVLKAPGAGEE